MALPSKITLTGVSENLDAGFTKVNTAIDYILAGDGTSRAFRVISVAIKDATQASKIKPSATSVFNGDAVTEEDNLAKGGDSGYFNLNAAGSGLHIESGAITGDATHVLMCQIYSNASGNLFYVQGTIVSNGITLTFTHNDGTAYDLTAAVDIGEIYLNVIYLTNA